MWNGKLDISNILKKICIRFKLIFFFIIKLKVRWLCINRKTVCENEEKFHQRGCHYFNPKFRDIFIVIFFPENRDLRLKIALSTASSIVQLCQFSTSITTSTSYEIDRFLFTSTFTKYLLNQPKRENIFI